MTNRSKDLDRDEVLTAFHEAYEKPTAENIIEWVKRYPEYAEDIRDHAAIALDVAARSPDDAEESVDERALNISFSYALDGLFAGDQESKIAANISRAVSFQEVLSARGKSIANLADEVGGPIGISRAVVSDLCNGGMRPPITDRFKSRVARALRISTSSFDQKVQYSLDHPRLGMPKSTVTPKINQRSYEEIIRGSSMNEEQIQYWLSED
jgi:hypothetical protein